MAAYTKYKNLEKPLSTEKYNIGVANKNSDVIDSELHRLDLKNESQDALLATKESLSKHEHDTDNPHNVSKAQIGLNNVDNTADLDKPVSTAQRNAINDIYTQANNYVDIKIANIVDGAPEPLNTLKKLADIIEENKTIIETLQETISNDFILINQQPLLFTNNICTISDDRITADSLAYVHFTSDTIEIAKDADISVETGTGNIQLTATNSPTGIIKASIEIRVV